MAKVLEPVLAPLQEISPPIMQPLDLLSACFNDGSPIAFDSAAWDALVPAAAEHMLLPALHSRLQEIGASPLVPPPVAGFLAAVETLNLERNQAIISQVVAVASLLNDAGIEPVLLKGMAYLSTNVYSNLGARYLIDVDLLVPQCQHAASVEILMRHGFDWDRNDRLGGFRHHHPILSRPGGIGFELHHSLGMGACKSLLPASEVLAQSVPYDLDGARVRLPSPEHMMIHLIMHSQIQHRYHERIWPPLRAMVDLVLLRRRFEKAIDWSAIESRFSEAGQSAALLLHLLQVKETLGGDTPFPIRLTPVNRLRWFRRKLLQAVPALRFFDPVYLLASALRLRLRVLRNALEIPGGWRLIAKELLGRGVFKRLATDLTQR